MKNILNYITYEMRKKGIEGDAQSASGDSTSLKINNRKIKHIKTDYSELMSVRVIKNGRTGIAGSNKLNLAEARNILESAEELSKYGQKVGFKLPSKAQSVVKRKVLLSDNKVESINTDNLIDIGKMAIDKVYSDKSGMNLESFDISVGSGQSESTNTNGVNLNESRTMIGFSLQLDKIREGDFFQVYGSKSSIKNDIDFESEIDLILEKVHWGKHIAKIQSGKYPVIFAPEGLSFIVSDLNRYLNGKFINDGSSKLKGKLGKKLFDDRITLIDDATLDYFPGSHNHDDEGVTGRSTILIEKGVVKNFYYDLQEGYKAKTESTGNGARSAFTNASPSPTNSILIAGTREYKKLIKDVKEGILAYYFLGEGQNNPFNGDFQLGLYMGYKIENGEVVGRLKDTAISGNIFDLLKDKILWISKERERHGSLLSPYLCLDNITVLSK